MNNKTLFVIVMLMFVPIGYIEYRAVPKVPTEQVQPQIECPVQPISPCQPDKPKEEVKPCPEPVKPKTQPEPQPRPRKRQQQQNCPPGGG